MSKVECVACRRSIDEFARMCPYCGADPTTGRKLADTSALMQQEFKPRQVSASESVVEYARQRQGIVIAVSLIVAFLILGALHQYVTMRNRSAVSAAAAVPLTEVTDLSNQPAENKPQQMPELRFQYEGHPQSMRNYIVESGAVTPPEVIAEQQAAAQRPGARPATQQRPVVTPPPTGTAPPAPRPPL